MTIPATQRCVLFVFERDLPLVFAQRNNGVVNGRLVWFGFPFYMSDVLFADPGVTSGTLVPGGKSILAVVAGTAIPAPVKRFHDKIFLFLGKQGLHFKQAAVAFFTTYFFNIHVMLMPEEYRFHRLGVKDSAAIGKAAPRGSADISDTENGEQNDWYKILFHAVKINPSYKICLVLPRLLAAKPRPVSAIDEPAETLCLPDRTNRRICERRKDRPQRTPEY